MIVSISSSEETIYTFIFHFYFSDVTFMLSAPLEVLEEEGSVISACVFITENTVLEREVTVMLFSVTDQTNIQGAYLYYIASKDSRT